MSNEKHYLQLVHIIFQEKFFLSQFNVYYVSSVLKTLVFDKKFIGSLSSPTAIRSRDRSNHPAGKVIHSLPKTEKNYPKNEFVYNGKEKNRNQMKMKGGS